MTSASKVSAKTMQGVRPLVLIAHIALTENRLHARRTTGVHLLAPQLRPVTSQLAEDDSAPGPARGENGVPQGVSQVRAVEAEGFRRFETAAVPALDRVAT